MMYASRGLEARRRRNDGGVRATQEARPAPAESGERATAAPPSSAPVRRGDADRRHADTIVTVTPRSARGRKFLLLKRLCVWARTGARPGVASSTTVLQASAPSLDSSLFIILTCNFSAVI
jgi:hypothetical protein